MSAESTDKVDVPDITDKVSITEKTDKSSVTEKTNKASDTKKTDKACGCKQPGIVFLIAFHDIILSFILLYVAVLYPNEYKFKQIFDSNYLDDDMNITVIKKFLSLLGALSILNLTGSSLLLCGAICRCPKLMVPWFLLKYGSLFVYHLFIFYYGYGILRTDGAPFFVFQVFFMIFVTCHVIYKYLAVRAYYNSILKPKSKGNSFEECPGSLI